MSFDCQSCGACCIEAGSVVLAPKEKLPSELVTRNHHGRVMDRHMGGRCKALQGVIGACVGCGIYDQRPRVCREFVAGSEGCLAAREIASYKAGRPGTRGYGENWQETV